MLTTLNPTLGTARLPELGSQEDNLHQLEQRCVDFILFSGDRGCSQSDQMLTQLLTMPPTQAPTVCDNFFKVLDCWGKLLLPKKLYSKDLAINIP